MKNLDIFAILFGSTSGKWLPAL